MVLLMVLLMTSMLVPVLMIPYRKLRERNMVYGVEGDRWDIRFKIGKGEYDGVDKDYFPILWLKGTARDTKPQQCIDYTNNLDDPGEIAWCVVDTMCTSKFEVFLFHSCEDSDTQTPDIGKLRCVVFGSAYDDGWTFSEMWVTKNAVGKNDKDFDETRILANAESYYIENVDEVEIVQYEIREFCVGKMTYTISVEVGPGKHDGTVDMQYVKIIGTKDHTLEQQCNGNFKTPGEIATCTIRSDVDIGEWICVEWRTEKWDGWRFTKIDVFKDSVKQTTFNNVYDVELDDGERKKFCLGHAYKISVKIASGDDDGTAVEQFVKIKGTKGITEELQCEADFTELDTVATCVVYSSTNIGQYTCVVWRNGGEDGWTFTKMEMSIDAVPQDTFDNSKMVEIGRSDSETFCTVDYHYQITVSIRNSYYSGTKGSQYVTIKGTLGETEEKECTANFNKYGEDVTCNIQSDVDIGDYRCVIWRNGGNDGWEFTQMKMQIEGKEQLTYTKSPYVAFKAGGTETLCIIPVVNYQITVSIRNAKYSGTKDPQYVTIKGTLDKTEEKQCFADFNVFNQDVTCTIQSFANIGEYRCVIWRTGGNDGWEFTQLKMQIDGKEQLTYTKYPYVALAASKTESETLCIPE